jgi:hypothetical protein
MRILPTRSTVATSLAAVLIAGLAGCGASKSTASSPSSAGDTGTGATAASAAPSPAAAGGSTGDSSATAGSSTTSASTGNPFADIRTAAQHMPGTADALAGGVATALKLGDVKSPASDLRAGLTYLFTEHVYLAGVAVATAYHAGPTSDAFNAAKASVMANAMDIENAVGSIVGAAKQKTFAAAFDAHIGDFVNYAVAAKGKDAKGKAAAVKSLQAYAKTVGGFFSTVTNKTLSASVIEQDTLTHINTLAAAVDALASGSPTAYAKLKTAADHMAGSAKVIATGVAKATKMAGSATDKRADLRSTLTGQLVSHVYLAGVAVFTAYTDKPGVSGDQFKAAAAALDTNSVDLSKSVGSVSDSTSEATFLQVWRSHITNFVDYAKADATSDEAAKTKALADLGTYTTSAGDFFAKITKGALPSADVATALKAHIATLAGAIDSLKKALVTSS